jgi:hypothetical protein
MPFGNSDGESRRDSYRRLKAFRSGFRSQFTRPSLSPHAVVLLSDTMRILLWCAWAAAVLPALAVERTFEFADDPPDQAPPGFRSVTAGPGNPGDWRVVFKQAAPALPPLSPQAPHVSRRAVLTCTNRGPASTRFPMLLFEGEDYRDFKFTARFKIAGGTLAETAGVVFHFQNTSNFYVARASALTGKFQCFKVADGDWKPPIGPEVQVARDTWHDLSVQCEGTRIICLLDGANAVKLIDSSAIPSGKIGFWTESDSAVYFESASVTYPKSQTLAEKLVQDALQDYPRLLGLRIYAAKRGQSPAVIASKNAKDLGQPGGKVEQDVIRRGSRYFGKTKGSAFVTVPLHDRNGDPIAAVQVVLKSFPGQTEQNAFARAQPIVQKLQSQVLSLDDLLQ